MRDYCMNICANPWPGEAAWICDLDENHPGAHREGGYQWADSHDGEAAS